MRGPTSRKAGEKWSALDKFATVDYEDASTSKAPTPARQGGLGRGVESLCHRGSASVDSTIGDVMVEPGNSAAHAEARPDPNERLVKVFATEQEPEALVVKGLLDSAGIESDLRVSGAGASDAFPGLGGMILLVREEDEEEAQRVIAEGPRTSSDDDDTAEISTIDSTVEEPPRKA